MQWADDIKIETPELVEVSLEVAGLGSRFVAKVVDWLVKALLLLVLIILAVIGAVLLGHSLQSVTGSMLLLALLFAVANAILLGYDVYYEVRHNGQTPGKKLAGIRAIREGGAPLDFQSACIRSLIGYADFLPVFFLLGALLVLVSRRGQRLGDMAAGTIVVRERALKPPADLQEDLTYLASTELIFSPEQLTVCTAGDRHILRSFFQRYRDMTTEARDLLARKLANTFLDKLHCESPSFLRAESFLASLYRDLETFHAQGRGV